MKRLLFVMAIGVSGFMSAHNTHKEGEEEKKETEVNTVELPDHCMSMTVCNETGYLCKENKTWEDVAKFQELMEDAFC